MRKGSRSKHTEETGLSESTNRRHIRRKDLRSLLTDRIWNIRSKCRRVKRECDIDVDWAYEQLVSTGFICAVTGIPLALDQGREHPWSLSFDRIDNSRGYTKDNVQIVCMMYNLCKYRYNSSDVLEMAHALIRKHPHAI